MFMQTTMWIIGMKPTTHHHLFIMKKYNILSIFKYSLQILAVKMQTCRVILIFVWAGDAKNSSSLLALTTLTLLCATAA